MADTSGTRRTRHVRLAVWVGAVLAASAVLIQPLAGETSPPIATVPPAETAPAAKPAHLEARLTAVPNAVGPGGIVRLTYAVWSTDDADTRVRVRVDAGAGWRVSELPSEEIVRGWNYIEGDVYLHAPDDAAIGERRVVRLLVHVLGASGLLETEDTVTVAKRSARTGGGPEIATLVTFGVSHLGAATGSRRPASALEMASKFRNGSTFSLSYDHGVVNAWSNFRYEEQDTRLAANLRHAGWDIGVGNAVTASGSAVTGPYVRGSGTHVRRPAGRWLTDLIVVQPSSVGTAAAGRLVRGRAGLRTQSATLAVSASDFLRPAGGYNPNAALQTTLLSLDTEDLLAFERRLTTTSGANRALGIGGDVEVSPGRGQRMSLAVGTLRLSNATAARVQSASGEASYSLTRNAGHLTVRWRDMPATVSGISLLGDERGADGSLRVAGNLHLVGNAYRNVTNTIGSDLNWRTDSIGVGLRVARGARRLEIRGNYRDGRYGVSTVRRTISAVSESPVGPFTVNGNLEVGAQQPVTRTDRVGFARGEIRWGSHGSSVRLSATHSTIGAVSRQRLDILGSVKRGDTELAGGAWATRGYAIGGRPGLWTTVGLPVTPSSQVVVGLDYSPLAWTDSPSLRGMVSLRRRMMLPIPFLHDSEGSARVRSDPSTAASNGS